MRIPHRIVASANDLCQLSKDFDNNVTMVTVSYSLDVIVSNQTGIDLISFKKFFSKYINQALKPMVGIGRTSGLGFGKQSRNESWICITRAHTHRRTLARF